MLPHTLAELRREMARLRLLAEQIREIETARLLRLWGAVRAGVEGSQKREATSTNHVIKQCGPHEPHFLLRGLNKHNETFNLNGDL